MLMIDIKDSQETYEKEKMAIIGWNRPIMNVNDGLEFVEPKWTSTSW